MTSSLSRSWVERGGTPESETFTSREKTSPTLPTLDLELMKPVFWSRENLPASPRRKYWS